MKRFFGRAWFILMAFLLLVTNFHPGLARANASPLSGEPEAPLAQETPPPGDAESPRAIFLALPIPEVEALRQERVALPFPAYYQQRAEPVLNFLVSLQQMGKIERFEEDMNAFGVRAWLAEGVSLDDLPEITDVQITLLNQSEPAETCAASRGQVVQDLLAAARFSQERQGSSEGAQYSDSLLAVPTIQVYISSYVNYNTRYASISGRTQPNIPVKIEVTTPNGTVIVKETVESYDDGWYYLSPPYQDCQGYGWSLSAGQTVTVTAGGATRAFQIPIIDAIVRPDSNRITGKTAASRRVQVWVNPTSASCSYSEYHKQVTSGADGSFSFDLSTSGGIDRSGSASVNVYDVNGSYVQTELIIPHIELIGVRQGWGKVAKPGAAVVATIKRGSSEIERINTTAGADGSYNLWFDNEFAIGDLVTVQAGGETMQMRHMKLETVNVDWQNGRVSGTTEPGVRVLAAVYNYANVCPGDDACATLTTNVSGDFVLNIPTSHLKRSLVYFTVYDSSGNMQFTSFRTPYVSYSPYYQGADYSYAHISGEWYPGVNAVTVRIKNGETVEEEHNLSFSNTWFSLYLSRLLPVGYQIEVTDGIRTRQLTVQNVTIRHDSTNNVASGQVPGGGWLDVIAYIYNRWDDYYSVNTSVCDVPVNGDGSFQVAQPSYTTSEDYMAANWYDDDGDYIRIEGYDLHIGLYQYPYNYYYISGNRPYPNQPVNITVRNPSGSITNTYEVTDFPSRSYSVYHPDPLPVGSTIEVTNGGATASYQPPALSLNNLPAENRVYGVGPAWDWVHIRLFQYGAKRDSWITTTQVNGEGNYTTSFAQVYNENTYSNGCVEARVGGCRRTEAYYYNYEGHLYNVIGPHPGYASVDAFDQANGGDNTPNQASVYQGVQSHTFHDYTRDPDWIAVQVSSANVGKLYSFQTLNLGDTVKTSMELYGPDKTTLLASHTGPEDAAVIRYKPTQAGWYYAKVTPRDTSGGDCGDSYDFRVQVEAEWTALLYLNGDSDLGRQVSDLRTRLEQTVGSLVSTNVVVLYDGMDTNTGDTWRYLVQPAGKYQDGQNRWYMGELNLAEGKTLAEFIRWGMQRYPASHYFLSVVDHGQAVQGLSWDFNTSEGENSGAIKKNFSNSDLIDPMELREAILQGTDHGANKIDVIYYDTCLMGLWETAYQIKDAAKYLIFSQNEGWDLFPYEQYLPTLRGKDANTAAQGIAKIYSERASAGRLPHTVSVIDLSQMNTVSSAVNKFSQELSANMNTYKQQIKKSRDQAQKFDSNSDIALTAEDTFVDLYDFAEKVKANISHTGIKNAAAALQQALAKAIVVEHHGSGRANNREGDQVTVNLDRARGLSIYFPSRSGRFFSIYNAHQMFMATSVSAWDEMLGGYYGSMGLPPYDGDADDTNPFIFSYTLRQLFLPTLQR